MNSDSCLKIVYVTLCALLLACGEAEQPPALILAGTIDGEQVAANLDEPILVAVMPFDASGPLSIDALTDVTTLVSVDKNDLSFEIDLTGSGLSPGDAINIAALVDYNADGQFPNPDPGDAIGFYMDKTTYSTAYTLAAGMNSGILITIDRTIYDCSAQISFQITDKGALAPQTGEAFIAIAVERQGLDLVTQAMDMDYVVASGRFLSNVDGPPYIMDVYPALYDGIPVSADPFAIDDIYLIAVIDSNDNGIPDEGESIGFSGIHIPLTQIYLPLAFDIGDALTEAPHPVIFSGDVL